MNKSTTQGEDYTISFVPLVVVSVSYQQLLHSVHPYVCQLQNCQNNQRNKKIRLVAMDNIHWILTTLITGMVLIKSTTLEASLRQRRRSRRTIGSTHVTSALTWRHRRAVWAGTRWPNTRGLNRLLWKQEKLMTVTSAPTKPLKWQV